MPNDDAERRRERYMALALANSLEVEERVKAILRRHPQLGPLFHHATSPRGEAEALAWAAVEAFRGAGDATMASRLEKDLERPTALGAPPRWGKELSRRGLLEEMKRELAAQPKPNVRAAAEAVAARAGGAVTGEGVRQEFTKIARTLGFRSAATLARDLWTAARAAAPDQS